MWFVPVCVQIAIGDSIDCTITRLTSLHYLENTRRAFIDSRSRGIIAVQRGHGVIAPNAFVYSPPRHLYNLDAIQGIMCEAPSQNAFTVNPPSYLSFGRAWRRQRRSEQPVRPTFFGSDSSVWVTMIGKFGPCTNTQIAILCRSVRYDPQPPPTRLLIRLFLGQVQFTCP